VDEKLIRKPPNSTFDIDSIAAMNFSRVGSFNVFCRHGRMHEHDESDRRYHADRRKMSKGIVRKLRVEKRQGVHHRIARTAQRVPVGRRARDALAADGTRRTAG
jgi:hypothetical protein